MKVFISLLLAFSVPSFGSQKGLCTKLLSSTSLLMPFKSLKREFVYSSVATNVVERRAVLRRFESASYHGDDMRRITLLKKLMAKDIIGSGSETSILTIEGQQNIEKFLADSKLLVSKPNLYVEKIKAQLRSLVCITSGVCFFISSLKGVEHVGPYVYDLSLLTFISGLWALEQNRQAQDAVLEYEATRNIPLEQSRYFSRTLLFDRVDFLFSRENGVSYLDIVHWKYLGYLSDLLKR